MNKFTILKAFICICLWVSFAIGNLAAQDNNITGGAWWWGSTLAEALEDMPCKIRNYSHGPSMITEASECTSEVYWEDVPYVEDTWNTYRVYPGYPGVGGIWNDGLSVADIVSMTGFINATKTFNNWEFISSDADEDQDVDTDDTDTWSDINLGYLSGLPGDPFYFVRYEDRSALNSTSSRSTAYSKLISGYYTRTYYDGSTGSGQTPWWMHGLKMGDVNASNSYYRDTYDCTAFSPDAGNQSYTLKAFEEVTIPMGEVATLEFTQSSEQDLLGAELHLKYDPSKVEVENIYSALPHFSKKHLNHQEDMGQVRISWVDPTSKGTEQQQVFSLRIRAKSTISDLSKAITFLPKSNKMEYVGSEGILDLSKVSAVNVYTFRQSDMLAFPNPFNSHLEISLKNMNEQSSITLTDVTGKVVLRKEIQSARIDLQLNHLQSGTYFINYFENGRLSSIEKVIKM